MDNKELLIELKNIKRALTCKESSSTSSPCCPETNNILTNIENNINSVIESCNDIVVTPQDLIVGPTSAQNTGLFCDLINCGCESVTDSKDLDYIGQINLVSGTTVEFNRVSSDGESVNTWQLTILDLSNNIQTIFSGGNANYNNPLGSFDLGGIGIGFYYDFVVNYTNTFTSRSRGYFKINQDGTTVEHRSALLYSFGANCNGITLEKNIKLDNPDINTSSEGNGLVHNNTDNIQIDTFNVGSGIVLYSDIVVLPFTTSGTKNASIIYTYNDGIVISYSLDKTLTQVLFTAPTDATTVFPNVENSYDKDNNTSWQIGNVNDQETYQVDWNLPISFPSCGDNIPAENVSLKFYIDIEAFDRQNIVNNGFIIAVTDGTTMYGILNTVVVGVNEIPITTPIPENVLPNLKVWLAELGFEFTIREVYAVINYTCQVNTTHQVIATKIECSQNSPIHVQGEVLNDIKNIVNSQKVFDYTTPVKVTFIDGNAKTFVYARNSFDFINGSFSSSLQISIDGVNWGGIISGNPEIGWDFGHQETIMITPNTTYNIPINSIHAYSVEVRQGSTGTTSSVTIAGGTPYIITEGDIETVEYTTYNKQTIDIFCDSNDIIKLKKQW